MRMAKKVFSLIALVLVCFSAFAFAGCDSASSGAALTIEINDQDGCFTFKQVTQDNWQNVEGKPESYMDALDKERVRVFKSVSKIEITGSEEDKVWKATTIYLVDGEWTNTRPSNNDKAKGEDVSAYEYFLKCGGTTSGLSLSKAPGTYKFTFVYNGVHSCEYDYKITA